MERSECKKRTATEEYTAWEGRARRTLSSEQQRIIDLCERAKEGSEQAAAYLAKEYHLKVWTVEQLRALQWLRAYRPTEEMKVVADLQVRELPTLQGTTSTAVVLRRASYDGGYTLERLATQQGVQTWLLHEDRPMFNIETLRATV